METIRVSEFFYSIQGEGRTMGVPAVFVRLQACNILCDGEWTCDTIDVWKTGTKYDCFDFLKELSPYVKHLKNGAHLIFTGGEPLIQDKAIFNFILEFYQVHRFKPFIEIETNGTKTPSKDLALQVDLFNCSFKLKNSGVTYERRIKMESLKALNEYNTIFKIVVGNRKDFAEAKNILDKIGVSRENIYLMPPADNIEELHKMSKVVAEICKEESINLSTRLQIVLWNKTVGV